MQNNTNINSESFQILQKKHQDLEAKKSEDFEKLTNLLKKQKSIQSTIQNLKQKNHDSQKEKEENDIKYKGKCIEHENQCKKLKEIEREMNTHSKLIQKQNELKTEEFNELNQIIHKLKEKESTLSEVSQQLEDARDQNKQLGINLKEKHEQYMGSLDKIEGYCKREEENKNNMRFLNQQIQQLTQIRNQNEVLVQENQIL